MTVPLQLCVRRSAPTRSTDCLCDVSFEMPSDVQLIEHAVDIAARHCRGGVLSSQRVRFHLRTALAEALANAILYGNQKDRSKSVGVRIELQSDAIDVYVTDEGAGFDPSALPDPTLPEGLEDEAGRGVFLIRQLVDELRFNKKGNTLCMTLRRT